MSHLGEYTVFFTIDETVGLQDSVPTLPWSEVVGFFLYAEGATLNHFPTTKLVLVCRLIGVLLGEYIEERTWLPYQGELLPYEVRGDAVTPFVRAGSMECLYDTISSTRGLGGVAGPQTLVVSTLVGYHHLRQGGSVGDGFGYTLVRVVAVVKGLY